MTQKELAKFVGVSRQTICAIERGKYLASLEVAFRIANILWRNDRQIMMFLTLVKFSTKNAELESLVRLFRLTPQECLAGVTRNAARALGLDDHGTLETGKRADIAVWDFDHPRELAYWIGTPQLAELIIGGQTSG